MDFDEVDFDKEDLVRHITVSMSVAQAQEKDAMSSVSGDKDYEKLARYYIDLFEELCPLSANLLYHEPLKSYDPRRLLMPLVMPTVQRSFKDCEDMLDERNFNAVSTDISDVDVDKKTLLSIMPSAC